MWVTNLINTSIVKRLVLFHFSFNFSIDLVPKYRYFWRSSSTQPWQQRLSDRSNHTAIVWGDFQVLNLSCPLILFLSVLSTKRARHTSGHGPFSSLTMCSGPLSLLLAPSPFLLCFVLLHSGLWVISLRASNSVCVCVCVCVSRSRTHTLLSWGLRTCLWNTALS